MNFKVAIAGMVALLIFGLGVLTGKKAAPTPKPEVVEKIVEVKGEEKQASVQILTRTIVKEVPGEKVTETIIQETKTESEIKSERKDSITGKLPKSTLPKHVVGVGLKDTAEHLTSKPDRKYSLSYGYRPFEAPLWTTVEISASPRLRGQEIALGLLIGF